MSAQCRAVTLFVALVGPSVVPSIGAAQQSDVSLSPFVSFFPATGRTALAGLAIAVSGSPGFGLRLNARSALRNSYAGSFGVGTVIPPWGADVDAVFGLTGRPFGRSNRTASSFAFLGIGASGADTAQLRLVTRNWSYGVGTSLPLGSVADLFADSRWRMSRFVLPTASPRPARTKELRFGLTFHAGGGADSRGRR